MADGFLKWLIGIILLAPHILLPILVVLGVVVGASLVVPDISQDTYGEFYEPVLDLISDRTRDSEETYIDGGFAGEWIADEGLHIHPMKLIAVMGEIKKKEYHKVTIEEIDEIADYFYDVKHTHTHTRVIQTCYDEECDEDEEGNPTNCTTVEYDCSYDLDVYTTTYFELPIEDVASQLVRDGLINRGQAQDLIAIVEIEVSGEYQHSYRPEINEDGFIWPTPSRNITSPFGGRTDPITGAAGAFHNGTDIGGLSPGVYGDPIWAMADGEVLFAGYNGSFGLVVSIEHSSGLVSYYAHLDRIDYKIRPGVEVKQGQEIGNMGNTGRSSGVHLHFEIRSGDTPIDAMSYY